MGCNSQSKSLILTEKTLRLRINEMLNRWLGTEQQFIPSNATASLKRWFLSLEMTRAERQVASDMTKEILMEYERRLRWIRNQLEEDVFKPFGG